MFEYTHVVKDSEGAEWGAFQNASMAKIMQNAMERKFNSTGITFTVEAIV